MKRYKDRNERPDKELREDMKKAVLKAASDFLARQADVQGGVSGGVFGSTEGRELLATGASAAPPLAWAESVASAPASSSNIDAPVGAALTSNRKRGGGDHSAAQVRTLQDVQCKLKDCADAEAVRIFEGAHVILNGNRDDWRRLCSKWKGVKRYKDGQNRPVKELREDLKSAVLKAASDFLARQADVQPGVSGGASGSTEGRELFATGRSCLLYTSPSPRDRG